MPMSGSPLVWIGSTTVGVEKAMPGAATAGRPDIDAPAATTNAEPTASANFGRTIPCLLASPNKGPADLVIPRVAHKMYRSPHPLRPPFTGPSQVLGMMNTDNKRRFKMNRRFAWIWGLATVAIASIVGLVAYHAGQTAQIVTTTGGDGRGSYPGYYGCGFGVFPRFGLFWLFLIGVFLFRLIFLR